MSRGLLLVGHGSHLNPDSSAPVRQHAAAIKRLGLFEEVRVGFWKEEPNLSRALDPFQSKDVTVVPVFVSAGYFTNEVIPREMGLSGPVSDVRGTAVRYTPPIGSHPALARVIVQRALEAGGRPGDALAVLGHGTPRNPDSERNVYEQAERARALGPFEEVVTVFLDQEPSMREVFALTRAETVVMVPLFVADGWHVGQTIPEDLALEGPETRRAGRRLRYAGAVGTHPSVVDVILELAAVDPDAPTLPGTSADTGLWNGAGRPDLLGQLRVERHSSGYLLHVEGTDAGAPGSPAQAGEAGRYDQHGRYRPLSGAPTLPPRLTAAAADDQELTNAIETIYPLALHHRALARNGELRVVAVEDVLQRQSGRYAVARGLGDPGRSVAAQTLCDAHCLRTPVWQPPGCDARHDAIGANIPCPEPCSVFVSLCREAALWEKERPDPAPVDDTVPFAAFDVPGNEIREKYLALRFGSSVSGNG